MDNRNRDFERKGGGKDTKDTKGGEFVVLRHRMISPARVSRFVIAILRGSRIGYRPDLIDASLRIYLTSLWSTCNAESEVLIPYSLLEKKKKKEEAFVVAIFLTVLELKIMNENIYKNVLL